MGVLCWQYCIIISNFSTDAILLVKLHSIFRSFLFDFKNRLSKNSGQNLTLALHLSSQEFHCMSLLEVENFTSSFTMDWKCICLFLMELRHSLHVYSKVQSMSLNKSADDNVKVYSIVINSVYCIIYNSLKILVHFFMETWMNS